MVTELLPARIIPVRVPPNVPVPVVRLSVTVVSVNTVTGVPAAVCACTTTLKPMPAVGLIPPLMEVIANFAVAVAVKVTGLLLEHLHK